MSDRYARLHYGYSGEDCSSFLSVESKPHECLEGSADAQNAVAVQSFISNALTFVSSAYVGSLSDEYGRRGTILRACAPYDSSLKETI
jgi:hypothetical protein